jgi:drug/metabolite transporter (DMT)-like permease
MYFSLRVRTVLQALLVTFLWSTSWVLIKKALVEIPPLTFAGLRYGMAFVFLLPGMWRQRTVVRALSGREWRQLAVLGFVFYALTQGGQFVTLGHLEAVTLSLLLNFTTLLVAFFGIVALGEVPSRLQWCGIAIFVIGVLIYFLPVSSIDGSPWGFALAGLTVCANAAASVLGRSVNRAGKIPPLVVTVISMGVGAALLVGAGLILDGMPHLSLRAWASIFWLAAVNTALAFTLWNRTLQTLSAVESSIINNTMLVQIAILAWLFLGERPGTVDVVGLILAAVGVLLAQIRR